MKFHEPCRPFRIEKKLQRVLCRRFRRSQRIKSRASPNLEVFASSFVIRRTRRNYLQQRLGKSQNVGLKCSQHRRQGAPLFRGRYDLRRRLPVAAQRKRIVHPSNQLARCLHLVAMQHVQRHKHVLQRRHRRALANVVHAKALQRRPANLHDPAQFIDSVCARIPQVRQAAR